MSIPSAWEIEQWKRQQEQDDRPQLEIPIAPPDWRPQPPEEKEEERRGVVVIQLW